MLVAGCAAAPESPHVHSLGECGNLLIETWATPALETRLGVPVVAAATLILVVIGWWLSCRLS